MEALRHGGHRKRENDTETGRVNLKRDSARGHHGLRARPTRGIVCYGSSSPLLRHHCLCLAPFHVMRTHGPPASGQQDRRLHGVHDQ